MNFRCEVKNSEKLGRYLAAAKDLKAGESILSDPPFVLGPSTDSGLVCFDCYLPLISKFLPCKLCTLAPRCPGEGCPDHLTKWHSKEECDLFAKLRLEKNVNILQMVQNVGSLTVLRALLKRSSDPGRWQEFMMLETHLKERQGTQIWEFCENTAKFIESLGLLQSGEDKDLVQKICAAIDVNSFEVRGPAIPAIGCAEILRGVYLKAALLAHDCVGNTHMSISDNNVLICHASTSIKKGEPIYYNYTDILKGTSIRQQHLTVGKYFKCSCKRCQDPTELGTYISSAICPECKGFVSETNVAWTCQGCKTEYQSSVIENKVHSCLEKLGVIISSDILHWTGLAIDSDLESMMRYRTVLNSVLTHLSFVSAKRNTYLLLLWECVNEIATRWCYDKRDEKELEEYIKNVSLVLSPNHYLLLDAKQRLAGVLRDAINHEPHPTKRLMKRKIQLCEELLPVLERLNPGISRIKAITLYELHSAMVQLSKKLFDARELTGSAYMDELLAAEIHLKRALEMLFIEPGNSPEGELCAKALEEYRALKSMMNSVLDGIHADGKTYVSAADNEDTLQHNI